MTPRDRREARVALAMLPVGVALTVIAVLAIAGSAAVLSFLAIARPDGWVAGGAWTVLALLLSVRIMLWGIETMSSFEPRPAILASAAIVIGAATCPYWYLP